LTEARKLLTDILEPDDGAIAWLLGKEILLSIESLSSVKVPCRQSESASNAAWCMRNWPIGTLEGRPHSSQS